ncbi:MAG: SDR family oxidoreductase [Bauldia sp.]|nr:SDR family oxidoreductase [Bauldia sp.]
MAHRVLVIGATGRTGRLVVSEALAAGHSVTAFARDPAKAANLGSGVGVTLGDVKNAASVEAAVMGHDTVILTLAPNIGGPAARAAIAGMKRAGGQRIIALSAHGVGDSRRGIYGWVMNVPMARLARDKDDMESAMAESGLDWTSARPVGLSNKPKTGRLRVTTPDVALGFGRIARADLAAWMVGAIDDASTFGKALSLSQA